MRRFFIDEKAICGDDVTLSGSQSHHLISVLRLSVGQTIELFDGTGWVYLTELSTISKNRVEGRIVNRHLESSTHPFPLTLGMGILKGKKMDLVLQKATELGVDSLIPLATRYSEQGKNIDRRIERWQRIMLEACKQCGRATPMCIAPVLPLQELDIAEYHYPVLCWEQEDKSVISPEYFTAPGSILLLIGPEGGFHDGEISWAADQGIRMTTLGSHILRAETAAIAGVGIIQYLSNLQAPELDS
jgi:16S rRNA (uracil1498-N3)-methyltransferase